MVILMKVLILYFFALSLNYSLADSYNESDRKYLSDLPEPSSENFRWLVPADAWRYKTAHLLKGRFFKISSLEDLKIYKTSALIGPPYIILKGLVYKGDDDVCGTSTYKRKVATTSNLFECNHASCTSLVPTDYNYRNNIFLDSSYLVDVDKYTRCSLSINYISRSYIRDDPNKDSIYDYIIRSTAVTYKTNHYIEYVRVDREMNYLEILVDGVKHYVDIRVCKKNTENCKEVDIKLSDYEKDWIKLKKHQEKKDLYGMNYLIANLRPCVEKKDIACIRKFLPDPTEDDYLSDWYAGYEIPSIKIDDELIKELKACLDYNNVLPHLYASRGISKVCIFHFRDQPEKINESNIKIINLTYPEAVRISDGFSIYLRP